MSVYVYVLLVILLTALSAFFSASEMALSSSNKLRLESSAEGGSKLSKIAVAVSERYNDALSTILICNNLVNFAASSVAAVFALEILGGYQTAAAAVITVIIIIFGETIPKIIAKKNANSFFIKTSWVIRSLMLILRPLVALIVGLTGFITRPLKGETPAGEEEAVSELFSLIETVEDEGVIDEERGELLHAALDFSETSASEIMTSRVDMVAIDIEDDWDEITAAIESSEYSRIPVYEDSADNIIGILHVNHFYKALIDTEKPDLRSLLFKPCYVYKTLKLPEVLRELKLRKMHLAIVTDEYGGSMGVITMEDVMEEIVGDIWDETDDIEPEVIRLGDGTLEVSGDTPLHDLFESLGLDGQEPEAESSTVGGWTLECFGAFPEEGDSFTRNGLTVRVLEMDGLRVGKVLCSFVEKDD